jgi:hypothetical protein
MKRRHIKQYLARSTIRERIAEFSTKLQALQGNMTVCNDRIPDRHCLMMLF